MQSLRTIGYLFIDAHDLIHFYSTIHAFSLFICDDHCIVKCFFLLFFSYFHACFDFDFVKDSDIAPFGLCNMFVAILCQ